MHWQFGEMEFGEMKRNTSNWSNFGMLLRRAGLTASAGLSCLHKPKLIRINCFAGCLHSRSPVHRHKYRMARIDCADGITATIISPSLWQRMEMPFASIKLSSMNVRRFYSQMLQQCHKLAVVAPSSKCPGKNFFQSVFNARMWSINHCQLRCMHKFVKCYASYNTISLKQQLTWTWIMYSVTVERFGRKHEKRNQNLASTVRMLYAETQNVCRMGGGYHRVSEWVE